MWSLAKILEKRACFGPKMAQNTHKMAQKGGHLGGLGGQFRVFEAPRPSGTRKNVIWSKKKFHEKNAFLGSFLARFVGICGHFGFERPPLRGSRGPIFGSWGPKTIWDVIKTHFDQKNFFGKKFFSDPCRTPRGPTGPGPGPARPPGPRGAPKRPKSAFSRGFDVLEGQKSLGKPNNRGVVSPTTFGLAQVMAESRFSPALRWGVPPARARAGACRAGTTGGGKKLNFSGREIIKSGQHKSCRACEKRIIGPIPASI